jgi:hypothetical protein
LRGLVLFERVSKEKLEEALEEAKKSLFLTEHVIRD